MFSSMTLFNLLFSLFIREQNAVTHKKLTSAVSEVKFKWTAPNNLQERVNFYVTIAKNGGVFWVAQKSDTLNVK